MYMYSLFVLLVYHVRSAIKDLNMTMNMYKYSVFPPTDALDFGRILDLA